MKIRRCLEKPLPTFQQFSSYCHFTNFLSKYIIYLKLKTSRKIYSDKIFRIILALYKAGKLYTQNSHQFNFSETFVVHIIHQAMYNQNEFHYPTKWAGRQTKLNTRAQQTLICDVEQNPHNNLAALGISFKSGTTLSHKIIQEYLKATVYL